MIFSRIKLLLFLLLCAVPLYAAPTVTVTATSTTLLGTSQTITLTCSLVDPNQTGILRTGATVITNFSTSTVTPGATATCGPLWGNDVVTDGFGNSLTSYYLIGAYTVSGGVIASTPVLLQAYQFTGSGTFDLSAVLPYSLGPVTPAGTVFGQNLTFNGNDIFNGTVALNGGGNFSGTFGGNLTLSAQLVSTVSTGTAPFSIASTTVVPNLNAQLHNGKTAPTGNIVGDTDTQTLSGKTINGPAGLLYSPTTPTITSGFGTSPVVGPGNGTATFNIAIGTGGTATNGIIALPTANSGWTCTATDVTTQSATVFVTKQISSGTNSATLANFNTSGAQAAWAANDILFVSCWGR